MRHLTSKTISLKTTVTRDYYLEDESSGKRFLALVQAQAWSPEQVAQFNQVGSMVQLELIGPLDSLPPGRGRFLRRWLQKDHWDFGAAPNPQVLYVYAGPRSWIVSGQQAHALLRKR
jgi:hypothetical protein